MELTAQTDWLYGIWLGSMVMGTLIIVYTDIAWYWIPDAAVSVIAISNGIGWLAGLFQPNLWLGSSSWHMPAGRTAWAAGMSNSRQPCAWAARDIWPIA